MYYNTHMLIVCPLLIFAALALNEIWFRRHRHRHGDELSRKTVHILVGCFVAAWPWLLDWWQIQLLGIGFILGVTASQYLGIFRAIHSVQRPTYGELCFGAAVGLAPLITHNKWMFAVAMLHMALADGLAAVVGVAYGRKNQYKVWGHAKSVAGSLTFFCISVALLAAYSMIVGPIGLGHVLAIALVSTLLENIAIYGLDNLFVPLLVAADLQSRI